jgi:hypothetical protein
MKSWRVEGSLLVLLGSCLVVWWQKSKEITMNTGTECENLFSQKRIVIRNVACSSLLYLHFLFVNSVRTRMLNVQVVSIRNIL